MKEFQSLLKDIKNKKNLPIYFLHGSEDFFIDEISQALEENVIEEDQKAFNQHILYGLDTSIPEIIDLAKQFPFGADKQLILVKEAQHLVLKDDEREILQKYTENPQMQTVLVLDYKGKKLDGKTKLAKSLKGKGYLFLSDELRDYLIPNWIKTTANTMSLNMDGLSIQLLSDHLGNNLSAIYNELKKLKFIVGQNTVTPKEIEEHIGINRNFNNFELANAVGEKDGQKAFAIINYFEKNPSNNPIVLSIAVLYGLFNKIIKVHTTANQSDANLGKVLKIGNNPYIIGEYRKAAKNYTLKKATLALEDLLDTDLKSKGLGTTASNDPSILREFVYKTIYSKE